MRSALPILVLWLASLAGLAAAERGPRPTASHRGVEPGLQAPEQATASPRVADEFRFTTPQACAETTPCPDDPEAGGDRDPSGTDREAPGALAAIGAAGLDAPLPTRCPHRRGCAGLVLTLTLRPNIPPPRG